MKGPSFIAHETNDVFRACDSRLNFAPNDYTNNRLNASFVGSGGAAPN